MKCTKCSVVFGKATGSTSLVVCGACLSVRSNFEDQVGGTHYNQLKIQPVFLAAKLQLDPLTKEVISYLIRKKKDYVEDHQKAVHLIKLYGEVSDGEKAYYKNEVVSVGPYVEVTITTTKDLSGGGVDLLIEFCRQFPERPYLHAVINCLLIGSYKAAIDHIERNI